MTAVYIILGILLFFFLLSLLRIGVRADFVGDLADTSVTVIAGPARDIRPHQLRQRRADNGNDRKEK